MKKESRENCVQREAKSHGRLSGKFGGPRLFDGHKLTIVSGSDNVFGLGTIICVDGCTDTS